MPNLDRLSLVELVEKFLTEVVKYNNPKGPYPLTWPTPAAHDGNLYNFRVKMTNAFWSYFITDEKRKLAEYNRRTGSKLRVIRDQTIPLSDIENLSLYLRRRMIKLIKDKGVVPPEISVKSDYVTLSTPKGSKRSRSTELSVLLGWDYSDWNGTAICKMLTLTEHRSMDEGKLTWGSLDLIKEYSGGGCSSSLRQADDASESPSDDISDVDVRSRKRSNPNEEVLKVDPKRKRK